MKILPLFVIIPLAAAFFIILLGKRLKYSGDLLSNLVSLVLCLFSFSTAKYVIGHGLLVYKMGGWIPPSGIPLVADGLTVFMLVIVNLVSFLVTIYATSYMRQFTAKERFRALFMFMLAGMNGVILSGDLFNLYIFLEIASISAYSLVAFGVEAESLEAAFKYIIMGSLASIFILLGIALLYSYASTLNMADIGLVLSQKPRGLLISFVTVLFLAGFGLKAALVPFHAWLPDAHSSAPSPVSAVLSGILIKTLGIYALVRVFFNVVGFSQNLLLVFIILGVLSMVVGAFLAVNQSDTKRMFAYSSISQIGYIILAFGIGTPLGIIGGLLHMFNHSVFKSLLFLNAGAIEYSTGERDLNKMGALKSRLPICSVSSLIASMSISGIPPLGGFWSKLIIIFALIEAGRFALAFVAVGVSIVTLVYYLKFQTAAFYGKEKLSLETVKDSPFTMKLAMVVLALICVVSGAMLLPNCRPFLQGAADAILSGSNYKDAVFAALRL